MEGTVSCASLDEARADRTGVAAGAGDVADAGMTAFTGIFGVALVADFATGLDGAFAGALTVLAGLGLAFGLVTTGLAAAFFGAGLATVFLLTGLATAFFAAGLAAAFVVTGLVTDFLAAPGLVVFTADFATAGLALAAGLAAAFFGVGLAFPVAVLALEDTDTFPGLAFTSRLLAS